jgi:hypothetical protein
VEIPISAVCQVTAGCLVGYIAASVSESICHNVFGHSPKWLRSAWRRHPRLFRAFRRMFWSHSVIHHGRTFRRNFVTQFRTAGEQAALDSGLTAWELSRARSTHYGLTITLRSVPYYVGPPSVVLPLLGYLGGWAVLSGFAMFFLPPLLSMLIHPLIHMQRKEVERRGGLLSVLMCSEPARYIIRHHWLHHRYPSCNFNLLPLGDYLLGTYRRPSPQDYEAMRRDGIAVD